MAKTTFDQNPMYAQVKINARVYIGEYRDSNLVLIVIDFP